MAHRPHPWVKLALGLAILSAMPWAFVDALVSAPVAAPTARRPGARAELAAAHPGRLIAANLSVDLDDGEDDLDVGRIDLAATSTLHVERPRNDGPPAAPMLGSPGSHARPSILLCRLRC